MKEIIKQLNKTEKEMDDPNNFICRCDDLKIGMAIYCYKHKKESPFKTDKERIMARLKVEKNKDMIKRLKEMI